MPTLPGLHAPASIRIDRWGIPHIRAGSLRDLFFVQGFNAARDRLWQIDLWRKRGLGLLAADLGPGYLMQDRAARLFLYRGDMAPEWAAYGDDAEMICTAFAEGVNAGVTEIAEGRAPLPPEFATLGTRPALWSPEDVVRIRSHCLTRNAASELARMQVLRRADAATDLLRQPLAPPVPEEEWRSMAPHDLPPGALAVFELATAPVTFSPERLAATLEDAPLWAAVDAREAVIRADAAAGAPAAPPPEGSNNWAVAPGLTATGRPILASDPHRQHAAPSLRYLAHLTAPGIDVIGAGEPSSPGIVIGHNGQAAFSLTIFCTDQEDVMVHDTRPGAPREYRYRDGWETMRETHETFAVKGHPDQTLPLRFTRYGPVVWEDAARSTAVSLRTVFTEPGAAPYMASLKSMRATSFAGFREALHTWGAPSVNQIYADTAGTIGWQPAGLVPRRWGWRGLAPVPGDGRYEWAGFIPATALPHLENPEKGFVHSANEMNLPPDWPHDAATIGHEWFEDRRADRIAEVLAEGGQTVAASCALQTDTRSALALRLIARLPADAPGAAMLHAWDGRAEAGSAPALLFELWLSSHLRPALLAQIAPDPDLRRFLAPGNIATATDLIEAMPDPAPLLRDTLAAAHADAAARFGPDPEAWRWGDLHKGYFDHPLTPVRPGWDVGPLAKGGSSSTVMLADYEAADYRVQVGASVRLVIDVGAWDNSRAINAPGQSGLPGSPHYDDLAPLWARGEYVPLAYSEAAVAEATETEIALRPA